MQTSQGETGHLGDMAVNISAVTPAVFHLQKLFARTLLPWRSSIAQGNNYTAGFLIKSVRVKARLNKIINLLPQGKEFKGTLKGFAKNGFSKYWNKLRSFLVFMKFEIKTSRHIYSCQMIFQFIGRSFEKRKSYFVVSLYIWIRIDPLQFCALHWSGEIVFHIGDIYCRFKQFIACLLGTYLIGMDTGQRLVQHKYNTIKYNKMPYAYKIRKPL